MRFRVIFEGRIQSTSGSIDDAARLALADAMAELNKLGAAAGNAAIDLVSSSGAITITCGVEADDPSSAAQAASDNMYLSLNKANIGTPRWPHPDHTCWQVEFMNARAEALVAA
jgi:hypothetical protein